MRILRSNGISIASLLTSLGLLLAGCSATPSSAPESNSSAANREIAGGSAPLSVQKEAETLIVEALSEVSAPNNPYALKSEDVAAAEGEGLVLSEDEWQALQALAVQAPSE